MRTTVQRDVRDGDESPVQGVPADSGRGGVGPAEADGHPGQLQGAVCPGRRHSPVRHGPHEPDEKRVADILSPDSGQKKLIRKRRSTARSTRSHLLRIRPFPIFQTAVIWISVLMRIMCTSAKTIPFTEQNLKLFLIQRAKLWWQTFPPASFPSLLT